MDELTRSIQEHMDAEEKKGKKEKKIENFPHFVEYDAVSFFNAHGLEKMIIEDGEGNKASLARTKNNEVLVKLTSSMVL